MSLQHMVGDGWVPEDILADYAQAKQLLADLLGVHPDRHSLTDLVKKVYLQQKISVKDYLEGFSLYGGEG